MLELIFVIRRVGGLEGTGAAKERLEAVIRRVGGLEGRAQAVP